MATSRTAKTKLAALEKPREALPFHQSVMKEEASELMEELKVDMAADRTLLPRLWYLPDGNKAVVVMTGDNHGSGGTIERFEQFLD